MTHPLDGKLECRDDAWVLTLARDFNHPPETIWPWLTDAERLRRWSPVVPDRSFDSTGHRDVRENPDDEPVSGEVLLLDPPRELVHRWGDDIVRWRLAGTDAGCRLTLEQTMSRRDDAAMNAAGWQICLDVLDDLSGGVERPRVVGPDAAVHGWEALRDSYAELLG